MLDETYCRTLLGIDEEETRICPTTFRMSTWRPIAPFCVEELAETLAFSWTRKRSLILTQIGVQHTQNKRLCPYAPVSSPSLTGEATKEILTSERLAVEEERLSYYHILPESAHAILEHASLGILLHLNDEIDGDSIARFPRLGTGSAMPSLGTYHRTLMS